MRKESRFIHRKIYCTSWGPLSVFMGGALSTRIGKPLFSLTWPFNFPSSAIMKRLDKGFLGINIWFCKDFRCVKCNTEYYLRCHCADKQSWYDEEPTKNKNWSLV
jgi:hypothetical protein